jgi:hypothetical protein
MKNSTAEVSAMTPTSVGIAMSWLSQSVFVVRSPGGIFSLVTGFGAQPLEKARPAPKPR